MAEADARELESTRTELRRGILELPQETAESAAQMRRVIVDQIEALAELNRIVARHGRGLDAVEPRRAARAAARRDGTNGRRTATPPRPAGAHARPPTSPRRAPHRADPSRARERGQQGLAHRPAQPRLARGGRPTRESRPAPAAATRWPPRAAGRAHARHSIESLDSLSVDIARMIDHDAAAELWDRYKRGERNVFTRRLYTLQGQKAFDEIRGKYRGDREFKQTVDRYIGEFERLLDEVSRDDRGQVVARTYLTSETGKVYTMLAHAAGRFDQAQ